MDIEKSDNLLSGLREVLDISGEKVIRVRRKKREWTRTQTRNIYCCTAAEEFFK
jgi:hypothetical protein